MEQVNKKSYEWLIKLVLFCVIIFFAMLIPAWPGMFILVIFALIPYVVLDFIAMKKDKTKVEKVLDIIIAPILVLTAVIFTAPVHAFIIEMFFLYTIFLTAYYVIMKVILPMSKIEYIQNKLTSLLEMISKIAIYVGFFFMMFGLIGPLYAVSAKEPEMPRWDAGDAAWNTYRTAWDKYAAGFRKSATATRAFDWLGYIFMTAAVICLAVVIVLLIIDNRDKIFKAKESKVVSAPAPEVKTEDLHVEEIKGIDQEESVEDVESAKEKTKTKEVVEEATVVDEQSKTAESIEEVEVEVIE